MNKQELIKKVKALEGYNSAFSRDYEIGHDECMDKVVLLIEQLDEPQRVKVKPYVAEWFEKNNDDLDFNIWSYIRNWNEHPKDGFQMFMNNGPSKPIETLIRMKVGYEVEEEPKWVVYGERGYLTSLSISKGKSTGWTGNGDKHGSGAIHFDDKEMAQCTAYITGGTVEKV